MWTLTPFASSTLCRAAVVVALVACTACGGGRARPATSAPPPPPDAAASPLEGEWRLTTLQFADGSTRKVTGYLRVDRFSTLSVRAELAPDEPAARPPRTVLVAFTARAAAADGHFDFAGLSMDVGAERLTDDAVPMDEWRYYELAGSTLRLQARDRSGRAAATLVFERAR